jgi:cytochrome c oxidase subunit 1
VFTIGGISGLLLAMAPIDIQVQDTYYVIAHFHYVLVAGSLFCLFAGYYYWVPKWTGHMYNEWRGKFHFWNSLIWVNVTFFPMHFLGLAGMPRRYADYAPQFTDFNMLTSVGAWLVAGVLAVLRGAAQSPRRRTGPGQAVGRCRRAGMDGAQSGAVPHVRDAARRQIIWMPAP